MNPRHIPQAYDFEIQPFEESDRGDTGQWAPVSRENIENEQSETRDSSPLVTATGLSPSTSYRFRARARHSHGNSLVSGISEVFATGNERFFFVPTGDRVFISSDAVYE